MIKELPLIKDGTYTSYIVMKVNEIISFLNATQLKVEKNDYMKIVDDPSVKTSDLMKKFKDKFKVYSQWNNDELDKNFPAPKTPTKRYFKKEQEPEMLGKSWNDIKSEVGNKAMNFREYILAFSQYFEETGKYLDDTTWTNLQNLPDGRVARGYWSPLSSEVRFFWYYPDYRFSHGGARMAIDPLTLNLEPSKVEVKCECSECSKHNFKFEIVYDEVEMCDKDRMGEIREYRQTFYFISSQLKVIEENFNPKSPWHKGLKEVGNYFETELVAHEFKVIMKDILYGKCIPIKVI